MYKGGRVLDGSVHVKLHTIMSQSASVTCCCAQSLSLSRSLSDTSDYYGQQWLSFGQFCTFKVTCPCEPVGFSHLLYTLSLSTHHPPSPSYVPVTLVLMTIFTYSLISHHNCVAI